MENQEVIFNVSRQELVDVLSVMDRYHRRDGYIAPVNGKLTFFDSEPSMDAAPITKDQIYHALSEWTD